MIDVPLFLFVFFSRRTWELRWNKWVSDGNVLTVRFVCHCRVRVSTCDFRRNLNINRLIPFGGKRSRRHIPRIFTVDNHNNISARASQNASAVAVEQRSHPNSDMVPGECGRFEFVIIIIVINSTSRPVKY